MADVHEQNGSNGVPGVVHCLTIDDVNSATTIRQGFTHRDNLSGVLFNYSHGKR